MDNKMEKYLPVVVVKEVGELDRILPALQKSGVHTAEITFRTDCAAEAIRYAAAHYLEMTVGVGTVINAAQCREALAAGAQFIVSPGLSAGVAELCRERDVPYYPGCVTPTEIMQALELGLRTVKFFPAEVYGGLDALRALAAPFPQVRFIPTGGIDRRNLNDYLAFDPVVAVGGSFFVKEALDAYDRYERSDRS